MATLAAFVLIAVLITIHEFGHFLAAKACGVGVRVFSVGIGGRLFGFTWRGTEYRISWLPFGGYVRMAGADPFMEGGADEAPMRAGESFMSKPPWQRLVILFAGPAMNLVLPFFVFTALMVAGEPQPRADVGIVEAGTPAAAAGIRPQDRVVEVAGTPTRTWIDVLDAFAATTGATVPLVLERDGQRIAVELPVAGVDMGSGRDAYDFGLMNAAPDTTLLVDDPASPAGRAGLKTLDVVSAVAGQDVRDLNELRRVALAAGDTLEVRYTRPGEGDAEPIEGTVVLKADPAWQPEATDADDALWRRWGIATATTSVTNFAETSAAKAAGVQVGDRVLSIDGKPVQTWYDVMAGVAATATGEDEDLATRPLTLQVRREGTLHTFTVKPEVVQDTDELGRYRWRPLLGVGGGGALVAAPMVPRPYPLPTAIQRATRETTMVAGFIVEQLGKLFTNEAAIRESLGGPVEIFRQTRAAAERGLFDWARQMGLFSISLGIINLLPIPVLDGGQMFIYLAEWVRGRPLPLVLRERAQQAGVIFLVLLMLFVLVNDIHRAAVG